MNSQAAFLAFDMGAESGRALLGRVQSGLLSVEEIHRFPNGPVLYNEELHWDAPRLWSEMRSALAQAGSLAGVQLRGIGVDTWGVDYALLGENGVLLDNPYHYRDDRTEGLMERVFARVPPDEIYMRTGIQFMQINTLFQLYAASLKTPRLLQAAENLVTMPSLFNYWLTGIASCEFTSATTTQFYDPRKRDWSTEIFDKLGLPTRILSPVTQPGTILGSLLPSVAKPAGLVEVPVVAPACHDTGSAVAAIPFTGAGAFISSGTWSLLGTETPEAVISSEAQRLNFTNEGGVCGTFRLLKNITGLWLLQACRREWQTQGREFTYGQLTELARLTPPFRSLVDPDHPSFLHPGSMPEAIARFCVATEQPVPPDPAAFTRAVLESLAFKYRFVLEALERLTGKRYEEIHIVGGGAKNELLNQFTAEALRRRIIVGPVEATALGNVGMQMLATGAATSLAEVRRAVARSFPPQVYEPVEPDKWDDVYGRFRQFCVSDRPQA
jgi:rhamnulokinase